MFKTYKTILVGILALAIVFTIGASVHTAFAAPDTNILPTQLHAVITNGNSNGGAGISVLDIPTSDLSTEESAALLFMREEEKLARDVYNTLYTTWGIRSFANIASSEQVHMDKIKLLLDRYGLTDPALAPGQFTDPTLQTLYNQLVAQGNLSIGDALKVGATIEEIDVRDLQTRTSQTDNADIEPVYTNLMNGSYNHLQAFTNALLNQTGETYLPQYLSAEQYQTIISSINGNGNRGATNGQSPWAGGNGNRNGRRP
jgi:hypothetical protein